MGDCKDKHFSLSTFHFSLYVLANIASKDIARTPIGNGYPERDARQFF